MHLNEIISRFSGAKLIGENSYQCNCPSHKDDKASLTITEKDNKVLVYCHAGCDTKDILASVGLEEKDLFNNVEIKPQVVAEYIYKDEKGVPLYKVVRYEPKNFIQARYDNGNWIFNKVSTVRHVLYNLPNVLKSDIVYFVEGEKDADNLNKLGLVATTTAGGASSFRKKAKEYAESLRDKIVYIIPDNDKPGVKYAEDIEEALKNVSKETKILKISDVIDGFKEKGDISDVLKEYGPKETIKMLEKLQNFAQKDTLEVELTRESVISSETFEKLYKYEINDIDKFFELYNKLKSFCDSKRITGFDKNYKLYKESKQEKYVYSPNTMIFPDLNENVYNSGKYEMSNDGMIYETIPNVGKILVCYHPILPIEKYKNLEDGTEKIKLAFYTNDVWSHIIVDKSTISSNQSIIKLSDLGISVTSENAKFLVKYLSEIENINRDKIKMNTSISRMGWVDNVLIPYSNKFEFDNEKDLPHIKEKFGESGTLEDWIEFFKEKRKFNCVSRIILASAVASILLKRIKQNGFTVHVWGTSEYGKTVACMVGQSIFGNPSLTDGKGIGINFNFTNAGLEYRLNLYNNIPLFVNEMQHQKDAKDYDKMLFLIGEGSGKSRSTKTGGIGKENSWNNVVITNGEKNIIKDNSNAGAYNRCLSCEITTHSYENLGEVADFVKENYGTPIREILKHLDEYDCKAIYKEKMEELQEQDVTNKQKMIEAIIMLGDKILTDIIFKDEYYLQKEDFEKMLVKKEEVAIEERALEYITDWYITEQRHFLSEENGNDDNGEMKFEIFGRKLKYKRLAIIPSVLRKVLQDNGYDYTEVLNAWKRKEYIHHEKNRNTLTVQIGEDRVKCIVLHLKNNNEEENGEEGLEDLPF